MNAKTRKKTFENRACMYKNADGKMVAETGYGGSEEKDLDEELAFALQDGDHLFSLGITTVLQCLEIAEKEGFVPDLPLEWWHSVWNRYTK